MDLGIWAVPNSLSESVRLILTSLVLDGLLTME
jgi:hypothetical protein